MKEQTASPRLKRWLAAGLIFASVGAAACDRSSVATIRIAVAGPMTGDQSKQGNDLKNGVELAVTEWNEKDGVLGKKIELLVGDDQHDPKQAVAIANKFVDSGVVGVVGHWNSSASIPASEVYHRANIPMITPASTNPQVTDRGYANVFRVCGRDDQQGKVAAEFVATQLKAGRVAVLHDKTTYGQGLADEFKKSLEALNGGRIQVVYYSGITQGDKDFRGVLTTVASKKPDVYFFGGIYPEGGLLVKQAKEVGLNAPMVSGDGVIDPVFIQIAGPSADGTYLTFSPDTAKRPAAQDVLKKYRARYGEPGPYSFYAYDAAQILLRAVQSAGTTDGLRVAQAIHAGRYDGITGRLQFDSKGDLLTTQYVVWITKNGGFEEFWKPAGA
ncbi:MAG TPA: branched-chain amino acid ABC transporter substrate-binding protein [Nitrospiria bacterium]|nr:branched-chain amino acid ABC transporter substrate-binding protein [Nitrospiria bacterium]